MTELFGVKENPKYSWIKSCTIAEEATNNCESAVDIIAAIAPEINNPASTGCNKLLASKGITCSGSTFSKNSAPKYEEPISPIRNAPKIPGTAQNMAIFLANLTSLKFLIAIYLINKCG